MRADTQKQRTAIHMVAFVILIIMVLTFISVIGSKFDRVYQAAMTGDQKTIREETSFARELQPLQEQAKKRFLTITIIVATIMVGAGALQRRRGQRYERVLKASAQHHHLSYHRENNISYPTATGSDEEGIIMVDVEAIPGKGKRTTIRLGTSYHEGAMINAKGEHEAIGSAKTISKIDAQTKNLINGTRGTWHISAGEIRYEHPGIVENEEELTGIITAAKKLRKRLAQV